MTPDAAAPGERGSIIAGRAAVLALLNERAPGATICPSEAARLLVPMKSGTAADDDWREAMPTIHAAVDELLAAGSVSLSWKGSMLDYRSGPYRIGRK